MKRFYKLVSIREEAEGYSILLDNKPVKTPGKKPLLLSSEPLAAAIMQEWSAQKEKIVPDEMPLTQIAATKLDRVLAERAAMMKTILSYIDTDLLCYRAETPEELVKLQASIWDPHLVWALEKFGSAFLTTVKLDALSQPEKIRHAAHEFLTDLDDDLFTVLQLVTAASGSFVLAARFTEGGIAAQDVFDAARVEEGFKAKLYDEVKYGPDPAQEKKDAAFLRDLKAAQTYLALLT